MRIHFLLLALGLGFLTSLNAQEVSISGTDAAYAGRMLEISIPGHPILDKPLFREKVSCDSQGSFRIRLDIDSTTVVFIDNGSHRGRLLVQAGGTYTVILPPPADLSYEEKVSPFFEPLDIPLRTTDPNDINQQIYHFDSAFAPVNQALIMARQQGRDPDPEELTEKIEDGFRETDVPWFRAYRNYKYGILALNAGNRGLEEISRNYLGSRVWEQHPGYMELFASMFRDFLIYYDQTDPGKGLLYLINRVQPLDSIRAMISLHPALSSPAMVDLVLLQELPSLFYRGDMHKESILILLSRMEEDAVSERFALYTRQLREKLASLVVGNHPPDFELKDQHGQRCSLKDFKGKYTYLMFCTPDHYGCMMEYPFLNSYMEKHSPYLEVVTIMVAADQEAVKAFMERNGYQWRSLYYGGNNGLLDDYLVKAYPVAYLLGPEGELILSPAPLPTDRFEQRLFHIMRSRGDI
jgi:hypothetical protein